MMLDAETFDLDVGCPYVTVVFTVTKDETNYLVQLLLIIWTKINIY